MKNPFKKEKRTPVVFLFVAIAAAAVAYLFITEDGAEARAKIADNLNSRPLISN
jgi:hypothetical protein